MRRTSQCCGVCFCPLTWGLPWSCLQGAGLRRLEAQTLATQAWVLREAGSGTRSTLEAALRNAGVDPAALSIAMTLPSNEAVLAAAEAGGGGPGPAPRRGP